MSTTTTLTQALRQADRVTHANPCLSYGDGTILHIHPAHLASRGPTFAQVKFDRDGERCAAGRRVYIADLSPIMTPAPLPCSPSTLRLVWPLDRAGEVIAPVVA